MVEPNSSVSLRKPQKCRHLRAALLWLHRHNTMFAHIFVVIAFLVISVLALWEVLNARNQQPNGDKVCHFIE